MNIDTNIDLDSVLFGNANYNNSDLELFYRDCRGFRLVTDVELSEYLQLCKEPDDETIQKILDSHYNEDHLYR